MNGELMTENSDDSKPTQDSDQAFTLASPTAIFPRIDDLRPYYDIAFGHISLESNLINYRFVWCMFANSALMNLYVNSNSELAGRRGLAIGSGLIINLITVILVVLAIRAQWNIYENVKVTLRAMRSRASENQYVPIHSHSYGGGLTDLGGLADALIFVVSTVFVFVWAVLGIAYP